MNETSVITEPGWWFVIQLVLAALYGGLIGGERQIHGRAAGLRTHILVCLGSAAVIVAFQKLPGMIGTDAGLIRMDPARAAAGVITGIGFLGAGTIIKGKDFVMGLTTAASIWVSAAIGIALGLSEFMLATVVTALVLLTLFILDKINIPSYHYAELTLEGEGEGDLFKRVLERLPGLGLQMKDYHLAVEPGPGRCHVDLVVRYREELCGPRVVEALSRLDGIISVSWK